MLFLILLLHKLSPLLFISVAILSSLSKATFALPASISPFINLFYDSSVLKAFYSVIISVSWHYQNFAAEVHSIFISVHSLNRFFSATTLFLISPFQFIIEHIYFFDPIQYYTFRFLLSFAVLRLDSPYVIYYCSHCLNNCNFIIFIITDKINLAA